MSSMLIAPLQADHFIKFGRACRKVLVPELNHSGQYANYLAPYLNRPVERLNMVTGLPMSAEDILDKIREMAK